MDEVLVKPVDMILTSCFTASAAARADKIKLGRIRRAYWEAGYGCGGLRAISGHRCICVSGGREESVRRHDMRARRR